MATKTTKFEALEKGARFTAPHIKVDANFEKVTADHAIIVNDEGADDPDAEARIRVTRKTDVTIWVPDPTPEELAAQAEERRRWKLEWTRRKLEDWAKLDLAKFRKNLDENPLYAFEWADGAIRDAARYDVAIRLLKVWDHPEGGYEEMVDKAREQVLDGARWPSNSTSALTNLVKQEVTKAYAEFVADCFGIGK
jgi:hypothetical protein